MKAVILAGGVGSRISEETTIRPKPMVEIGGKPVLWHIMKHFGVFGINEFIVCLGYKGYMIKEYFSNYFLHTSDVTFDLGSNNLQVHQNKTENWKVTLIDTGDKTMTGGRLKRVKPYLTEEPFLFAYGDGLSNVNISELISFHKKQGSLATVTAVRPPIRFGVLRFDKSFKTSRFEEKPRGEGEWISGGYFVLSPKVIDYIEGDETYWERGPLERLTREGNLCSFVHEGFWQPMDTLRDKNQLEEMWNTGKAPWKLW